jgi:hypothetical protein
MYRRIETQNTFFIGFHGGAPPRNTVLIIYILIICKGICDFMAVPRHETRKEYTYSCSGDVINFGFVRTNVLEVILSTHLGFLSRKSLCIN